MKYSIIAISLGIFLEFNLGAQEGEPPAAAPVPQKVTARDRDRDGLASSVAIYGDLLALGLVVDGIGNTTGNIRRKVGEKFFDEFQHMEQV